MNYACTFRCRHCLYCSSPGIVDEVKEDQLVLLIDSIADALPGVFLHIGGGEPAIHFNRLCSIIPQIIGRNIILEYVETNGFPFIEKTDERLRELKNAGLDRLLLSISPFHHEFISYEDTVRIFRAILSVFGEEGIFPWHPGFLPYLDAPPRDLPLTLEEHFSRFKPYEILQQLQGIMYIHPGGRGAYLLAQHLRLLPPEKLFSIECRAHLSSPVHAHMDYEGNYLTGFCSGLRIGKNTAFDLQRLYRQGIDLTEFPILEMLVKGGLKSLHAFACEKGYEPLEGYVSPCHLCLDERLFLHHGKDEYPELYPSFLYRELGNNRRHAPLN